MNKERTQQLTCDKSFLNTRYNNDRILDRLVKHYRGLYPDNEQICRNMLINELTLNHIDGLTEQEKEQQKRII